MIRKFNYTGRQKIKRSNVKIDLMRNGEGTRFFNISIHLDELDLPDNAHIYIEAYHRSGYQRFDFGSVGEKSIPSDRRLGNLSSSAIPLFRVKVVDRTFTHGRILASVDKIRPQSVDDDPTDSQSLLFVEFEDLGNVIWELDIEGDWPTLRLNTRADEISLIASSDNRFLSLVYPEIVKQILTRVLLEDEHTDPDCDDDWPSLWLKLASTLPGMDYPPQTGKTAQERWIEKAVEAFSVGFDMLERFNKSFQELK
ncbi:MAG: hypothetical protein JRJ85_04075 [Deltaproteobacteria bacterium]|nr:hypothetical protein [Deltaproteobacteria bacterium]